MCEEPRRACDYKSETVMGQKVLESQQAAAQKKSADCAPTLQTSSQGGVWRALRRGNSRTSCDITASRSGATGSKPIKARFVLCLSEVVSRSGCCREHNVIDTKQPGDGLFIF